MPFLIFSFMKMWRVWPRHVAFGQGGIIFKTEIPHDPRPTEGWRHAALLCLTHSGHWVPSCPPRCLCSGRQRRFMLTDHNEGEVKGCVFLFRFPSSHSFSLSTPPHHHTTTTFSRDRGEMLFPVFCAPHIQSACSGASSQSSKPFHLEILMFASINRLN